MAARESELAGSRSLDRAGAEGAETSRPLSVTLSKGGVKTAARYKEVMGAMMSDLLEGAVVPAVGNAVCNAGRQLVEVVKLELKYGPALLSGNDSGRDIFGGVEQHEVEQDEKESRIKRVRDEARALGLTVS